MKKILFFAALLGFAVACGGQQTNENTEEQSVVEVEATEEATEEAVEETTEETVVDAAKPAVVAPAPKAEAKVEAEVAKPVKPIESTAKVGTTLTTGEKKEDGKLTVKGNIDPNAPAVKKAPTTKTPVAKTQINEETATVKSEAKVGGGLTLKK